MIPAKGAKAPTLWSNPALAYHFSWFSHRGTATPTRRDVWLITTDP